MSKATKATLEMARKEPAAVMGVEHPVKQAFTVERCPGGWRFVIVHYKDDGMIDKIEKTEPDLKPIILEKFKITALKYWTSNAR